MVEFNNDWDELLKDEFKKEYYLRLRQFLINEYRTQRIFPGMYDIFNAFKYTSYDNVKAVIIGQDPYHGVGQAHGLCFSVKKGVAPPPSLVNIFKEIKEDVGIDNTGKHGELTKWAENGVLLLNNVLTVREGCANSHKGMGWEEFTDDVIKLLNEREWYSCCGVQMHGQKQKLLLIPIILYLHAPTPVRFRHITDFSDADIFQKQMRF